MRFVYPEWSEPVIWGSRIPTVVIENQLAFRNFLCEVYAAAEGGVSKCVLSKEDKILDAAKHMEIISEFVCFDINKKPLLNKIIGTIENVALNGENYLKAQKLLADIENLVDEWSFDYSCDIVATKLSIPNVLKAIGLELKNDYSGHSGEIEKIIDYMDLVREFDRDKVFVFVNMRAFFADDDVAAFFKTCLSHEYKVLMIESQSHPFMTEEKRITIDMDLCEF